MNKIRILLFLAVLIIPYSAYASICDSGASTVVYINGIFTDEVSAQRDKDLLQKKFIDITENEGVSFVHVYNESHLAGLGDIVKSVMQAYNEASLDYDLTNMLGQVHKEVRTSKILLFGHSQGTFYTNAAYEYLIENGISKESIAVYNVGTPADRVAGGGNYLTSSTDKLINSVVRELINVGYARKPLAANIDISLSPEEQAKPLGGHSFSRVYLASAPEKIIGDTVAALDGLENTDSSSVEVGCFTAPKTGLIHKAKGLGFFIGDATFQVVKTFGFKAFDAGRSVISAAKDTWHRLAELFKEQRLFGASLVLAPGFPQNSESAIVLESTPPKNPDIKPPKEVDFEEFTGVGGPNPDSTPSIQDQIDDILERIDILKARIAELQGQNQGDAQIVSDNQDGQEYIQVVTAVQQNPSVTTYQSQNYSSSSSSSNISYPTLLISEVQIEGENDSKEEFVELYNPTATTVSLTDWYLQRKTATGSDYTSFATNTLFEGKSIPANGYFLIARQGYFTDLADMSTDNPLTENNSLMLKNPGGDIADKVGWGEAQEYETFATVNPGAGQSIGRKAAETGLQDTNNNFADFELNIPTPKAANTVYVEQTSENGAQEEELSDTTVPEVIFTVESLQESLEFSINFEITDPLGVVTPSGIDSYIFRWQKEGEAWQEDTSQEVIGRPTSINAARNFTGNDETAYYFQVKAKDAAGNESEWLPEEPAETKISLKKQVLINEIHTDGKIGTGGTDEDWVELYNPNDIDVPLDGWSIQKHSKQEECLLEEKDITKKNFAEEAFIPAKGFFLVVDTKASEALQEIANMTIGWSLSDNNTVYLVRAQEEIVSGDDEAIVDKVGFGPEACFPETSPAENPPEEKSIARKSLGVDTDNNSQDFMIFGEVTPGYAFPRPSIWDETNYTSVRPSSNVPGSPGISFLIKWKSNAVGALYEVQSKFNDADWKDWLAETTKTQEFFVGKYSLLNDNVYKFRVRTHDSAGNISDWVELKIDLRVPVIINEVAWAGTNADPQGQWVELYNRGEEDVDLEGWSITSTADFSNLNTINLSGVIPAGGYFLLEKNNDETISDIAASAVFETPILANRIFLRNPTGRFVDEFFAHTNGLGEGNFINGENRFSMERLSPYSFGWHQHNWKLNNGLTINGLDKDGGPIYGTPGAQNSRHMLYTYYNYSFTQDTALKEEWGPYLFDSFGNMYVFEGVTLTIAPGAVVKFADNRSRLSVRGTLKAVGTEDQKIIFTAFGDDEYGLDSNGDGAESTPVSGSWLSLHFLPESHGSELENVVIRYGGAVFSAHPFTYGNAIWVEGTEISIKDSVIEHNKNRALVLTQSDSIIDNVQFFDNNTTDWPFGGESKALYVFGGNSQIKNSHFSNNFYGIYLADWDGVGELPPGLILENNTFANNGTDIGPQ